VLEDRLLVWKFRHGSKDAFCRIYEKYRDDLLRLAISLLNEADIAEDVVHDVFTLFIQNANRFQLSSYRMPIASSSREALRVIWRRVWQTGHEIPIEHTNVVIIPDRMLQFRRRTGPGPRSGS